MSTALVTGSSGFIGGHLVTVLKNKGYYVIGVDIEPEKYSHADKFYLTDLRVSDNCKRIYSENQIDVTFNLACLMGGMGYINGVEHAYDIMIGSTLIVANILDAAVMYKSLNHFYSSSACIYNETFQMDVSDCSLAEWMAYPAQPDLVYGWQKLFSEQMYQAAKSKGVDARIARFHNIFGTNGTWDGGKEKAPAAICRKVSQAKDGESIVIWGDGNQTRSFLYVDECIEGIFRLMDSDITEPLNIGSDELISINDLAKMVIEISGKNLTIEHDLTKPQGVRGRNSNNSKIHALLNWKPSSKLYDGIKKTYEFINNQVHGNN